MHAEDEAKTKWCPFARVVAVTDVLPYMAGNRVKNHPQWPVGTTLNPETARCIGSACMAWRKMPATLDDATPIAELELSIRTVNALQQAGVQTVADLRRIPPVDFLRMRNVGSVTLAEIESILRGPPPSYLNQPQRGYCGLAGRPA